MKFETVTLENCVEKVIDYRGKTPKKLGGDWEEYGEYRAISAKNIKKMTLINTDKMNRVNEKMYKKWMKEEVEKGDIFLTSEAPLGESLYWDSEEKLVLSQRVFSIRADISKVYPKYLAAFISSPFFQHELQSRASGSTVSGIRQKELLKTKIKLIPDTAQYYIGNLFYDFNKLLEVNEKTINLLEKVAATLFQHWFVDFEFPDENGNPYKSSGGKMVESELGEIPFLFTTKKLSDICEVKDGTHDSPKQKTEGYPLVTSKHLLKNNIDFASAKLISEEDYNKVNKRSLVERYDILISMIGTVGRLYLVQNEKISFAIKNIGLIKTSQINDFEYIYCYIHSAPMEKYIKERTSGSTQQFISLTELRKIPVLVPPMKVLVKFKKAVKNIFEMIYLLTKENASLKSTRDILLPKLLSGEIELPVEEEVRV